MHVVKFFDSLFQAPNIEIVEAALPKARQRIVALCKCESKLSGRFVLLAAQAARNALLQNLNHGRRRTFGRLADEQMDVLGHDHVAHQRESIAVARFAENPDERVPGANRAQKRQAPIAGEGDEMQMAAPVMTNEFMGHGTKEKSKPRPFKTERVGHPEKLNRFLRIDVLEWYHPCACCRQEEKTRKGGPPARR